MRSAVSARAPVTDLPGGAQAALEAERAAVEAVRARKLQELEAAGVPAKYRAELAKKKLVNW